MTTLSYCRRLRLPGVSQIAVEATRAIGDVYLGAEDERHALVEHSARAVERWYRVRRWMLDEHHYLARQLSLFNIQAHRGIPLRW
jgi:hypothetical protein